MRGLFAFYEHAHNAYVTGEIAQCGNIILKKGVLKSD